MGGLYILFPRRLLFEIQKLHYNRDYATLYIMREGVDAEPDIYLLYNMSSMSFYASCYYYTKSVDI